MRIEDWLSPEKPRNFEDDLRWSDDLKQWSFYLKALSYFFPDTLDWQRVLEMLGQRQGKDIVLEQPNDVIYRIQIKARREDWGDFLIEWRHDCHDGTFIPGWMEIYTPQNVSHILYTIPSKNIAYNVPFAPLHRAWHNGYREIWIGQYDLPPSPNPDYNTRNCGVPWVELKQIGAIYQKFEED